MARLSEAMVLARTHQSELTAVTQLNCWGGDLEDVSIVRKLPNVEAISLSKNRIKTLEDFEHCEKLQQLFVRQNNIQDLREICYLKNLPALSNLWLHENPCAASHGYRSTVIVNLPKLRRLDEIDISEEERAEACYHGRMLSHPAYTDINSSSDYNESPELEEEETKKKQRSSVCSPDTNSGLYLKRNSSPDIFVNPSQDEEDRYRGNTLTTDDENSNTEYPVSLDEKEKESLGPVMPQEFEESDDGYSNSHGRRHIETKSRGERQFNFHSEPRLPLRRSRTVGMLSMQEHPYVSRRQPKALPKSRNVNVVNAVLCLIKELDIEDLELISMNVNCRMDELRL